MAQTRTDGPRTMLEAVRVSKKLKQVGFKELAGISQPVISDLERGARELDPGRRAALATAMNVPPELLEGAAPAVATLHALKVSLPSEVTNRLASDLALAHRRVPLILGTTASAISLPEHYRGDLASDAARRLRRSWAVPPGPIPNLVGLLEAQGIVCIVRDLSEVNVAALGSWPDDGQPVILLNANTPERERRFALAHELGHAALRSSAPTSKESEAEVDPERDADKFAAEFLLPADDIRGAFDGISLARLSDLEKEWGVTSAELAKRALGIRAVSGARYRDVRARIIAIGSLIPPAIHERPTLLASAVRERQRKGSSSAEIAASALLNVDELRHDYLAGSLANAVRSDESAQR